MIRDAWDGSIQDIELEVTGFQRQQFTEEQERAAVESAVSGRRSVSMRYWAAVACLVVDGTDSCGGCWGVLHGHRGGWVFL
jgi:hypothetical protein